MHTILVVAAGLLLLGVFLLFGKLWGNDAAALACAARLFLPAWLLLAIANLWVGVHHAGYSLREELPILLVIFAIPAALAALAIWFFARN